MNVILERRVLSVDETGEALARLRARQKPLGALLLADGEPARVVWANAAAVALFDERAAQALSRRLFVDGGLQTAVGRLANGGNEHYERLRVIRGLRSRTVTVALSRLHLETGRWITAIAAPDSDPDALTGEWSVSALVEDPLPLAPGADAAAERPAAPSTPAVADPAAAIRAEELDRYLWRTDARNHLVLIEGGPELVRRLKGDLIGRSLPDVFAQHGCDPEGRLAKAFAGRGTWSGLRLTWPVARDGWTPEVVLGAVPLFGPTRDFQGYRGFGTVHATHGTARPEQGTSIVAPEHVHASTDAAPEAANDHGPAGLPFDHGRGEAGVTPDPAARGGPAPAPPAAMASDQYSSKVVLLRPYQAVAPLSGAAVLSDGARLSATERSAFEEIGLALAGQGATQPSSQRDGPAWDAALIDLLPMAIWYEEKGSPPRINRAFASLTGYASAEDLSSRGGIGDLLGGADLPLSLDGADRVFSILDAHGRAIAVEGHGTVVDAEGRESILLLFRRAAPTRADTAADLTSDCLVLLDSGGTVQQINRAGQHLFGRPQDDLVGRDLVSLLVPEDCAEVSDLLAGVAARNDDQAATARVRLRRMDGTMIHLLLSARRFGPSALGATLREETAVEPTERAHAEALDQVARLKQSKADFLAKVSHDVRTPLNGILGFAEVILDERFGPIGNPRYRDYLLDIHQSGAHVLAVISDLLDLSKMEAGRFDISVTAVDVNRIVADCVTQMQPDAHRDRIIMRTSLLPRLPSALVDERALRQMMANVLSNAVKFNEPGGQVIVSTALNDAGAIAVRVRDTGVGMSETEIAAATEPFRQVATLDTGGGSGLGLSLTKALAEANGATIAINSRKQEGTLIEIMLRPDPDQPIRVPAA